MDLQSVGETLKLKAGRAAHRERGKRDGSAAVAVAVAVADDDARLLMHGVCSPGPSPLSLSEEIKTWRRHHDVGVN
jgi:hypothetical protein